MATGILCRSIGPIESMLLSRLRAGSAGIRAPLPEGTEPPPFDEMERLWEAKEWERLAELDVRVWVDGWGQPRTRIDPDVRSQVHHWILSTYRAEKPEGKPQPLEPPATERLDEVRMPTLVMIGTADELGGVLAERRLAASVPDGRSVEFEGTAHMIQLEEPERFNRVVLDSLAEVDRTRLGG